MRLEDNQLPGLQMSELRIYSTLQHLNLAGNQIEHVSQLRFLNDLPNLINLNIKGNPVFKYLVKEYEKGTFD